MGNHVDPDAPAAGAVYIFEHDGDEWIETAKITPSNEDSFGNSVDLKGDDLVVGAVLDSENGPSAGAAFVFRYDGTNWVEVQKLLASDGGSGDGFGIALAIADDSILIGAPGVDIDQPENGLNAGAVYRFAFDARATAWIEIEILMPSDAVGFKDFGKVVDASGDVAVISTPGGLASLSGAYVFALDRSTNQWVEQQKLEPLPSGSVEFGRSSAINEGLIIVSDDKRSNLGLPKGSAHVFEPDDDGKWVQTALLRP